MRAPLNARGGILGGLCGLGDAAPLGMPPLSAGPPAKEPPTRIVDVNYLHPALPFSRASTARYLGLDGLVNTAAINQPRFHYDSSGRYRGLLIEPLRTNICLRSEAFDNATWTKSGGGVGSAPTVTADYATAPDGNNTADRVQCALDTGTSVSDFSFLVQQLTTSNLAYAHSLWIKATSSSEVGKTILLRGTAGTTYSKVILTSSWQRVSTVETSPGGASQNMQFGLRGGNGSADSADFLVWGAQIEATSTNTFMTSYVPTTSANATRSADSLTTNDCSFLRLHFEACTFFFKGDWDGGDSSINANGRQIFQLSNANSSERLAFYNGSGVISGLCTSANATQAACVVGTTIPANTSYKYACRFAENNFRGCKNGTLSAIDLNGFMPVNINSYGIFTLTASSQSIEKLYYYRHGLSDGMLQAITNQDPVPVYGTWNPADKNAAVTLTNNNLTVNVSASGWAGVRSANSHSTGLLYMEFQQAANPGAAGASGVGLATAAGSLSVQPGFDVHEWCYQDNGYITTNSVSTGGFPTWDTVGDVAMLFYNAATGKLWVGANGTWSGNPNAGTGEAFSGLSGALFAFLAVQLPALLINGNFGATPFLYPPPTGGTGWSNP